MRKFFIVAMVAAAVMIAAAGCGGSSDASQVIDKAYQKSMDYKTLHTEFNVELGVEGDLSSISPNMDSSAPISLGLEGNADLDVKDHSNPAAQGNINIKGLDEIMQGAFSSGDENDASSALGAGLIGSMLSRIDFVVKDKAAYINIMGSWYQADISSMLPLGSMGSEDVDTGCLQDGLENIKPSQVLSDIQQVGSEDVDGKGTNHYQATVDMDKLVDVGAQISRDCGQAEIAGGLEGAKSSLSQTFKKLDVEMWIDGDDNLRKVVLGAELDGSALGIFGTSTSASAEEMQALESLSVTLTATTTQ
jgi:hypothetical protein